MLPLVILTVSACSGDDAARPTDRAEPTEETGSGATDTTDTSTSGPQPLAWVVEPTLVLPDTGVYLARTLSFETSEPTRATLVIDDGEVRRQVAFDELATVHDLAVLGLLADATHTVSLTAVADDGEELTAALDVRTNSMPIPLPQVELVTPAAGAEAGYTWVPARSSSGTFLIAYDLEGRPRYVRDLGADMLAAMSQIDESDLVLLVGDTVLQLGLMGPAVRTWSTEEGLADVLIEGLGGVHHEALWLGDEGFWSLSKSYIAVDEYPIDPLSPTTFGPAELMVDHAVHIRPDGTIAMDIDVSALLDTHRISTSSHDLTGESYNWSHANAVATVPGEDAVLVSLRHQDAVLKIDTNTGELVWILANHDGWPPELQDKLLTPVGEPFMWPTHQHAPMVNGDRVVMFDNGNNGRRTPYSDTSLGLFSRVVEYRIDEAAMEIEQTFQFTGPEGETMYSNALGNADYLPETGHVLATFSYLKKDGGVSNEDIGRGRNSTRVIEMDPVTGAVAWDLRVYGESATTPDGWLADRCTRVASLYAQTAVETVLP